MKFLLKLKHWQLFTMTYGLTFLLSYLESYSTLEVSFYLAIGVMILGTTGTLGWIWAIATKLNSRLPSGAEVNKRKINVLFSIPLTVMFSTHFILYAMIAALGMGKESIFNMMAAIYIGLSAFAVGILIWGMGVAAKTLKSIELGRKAGFSEYAKEFLLVLFSMVGYWILQPRLNKLIEAEN